MQAVKLTERTFIWQFLGVADGAINTMQTPVDIEQLTHAPQLKITPQQLSLQHQEIFFLQRKSFGNALKTTIKLLTVSMRSNSIANLLFSLSAV